MRCRTARRHRSTLRATSAPRLAVASLEQAVLHALRVDVVVIGEALVDVVVRADGSVLERPGGSPANVAIGLARLGRGVELITALGRDGRGKALRAHAEASGVKVRAAAIERTSVATATVDAEGAATYDFDVYWDLAETALPAVPKWLHVGSLGSALSPGADRVLEIVEALAPHCRVSFDPNCRPSLSAERDLARVERLVRCCDTVKLSDEDAAWLYPDLSPVELARAWQALGPTLVVVTLGSDGAVAVDHSGVVDVPVPDGPPIRDTVGAGDAFMAGLISELVGGSGHQAALHKASHIARITCTRDGADPPWEVDIPAC